MTKDARTNIVISQELLEQGKALAAMQGITFSDLLCTLLKRHVDNNAVLLKEYVKLQKQLKPAE